MILFVVGTDTGIGKTVATGILARALMEGGKRVITQKPVQTGATSPEDIEYHRRVMELPPDPPELLKLTCPYIFPYPAAPETAARVAGKDISLETIIKAAQTLAREHDFLLIEGAGGLLVPLTATTTTADLILALKARAVVVSPARLGTINHTLLTLEALKTRGIPVKSLVYNLFFAKDPFLAQESLRAITQRADIARTFTLPPLEGLSADKKLLEAARRFLLED